MKYVVIGGGIAGTCCTEELCRLVKPDDHVVLISAAPVLKVGADTAKQARLGCFGFMRSGQ